MPFPNPAWFAGAGLVGALCCGGASLDEHTLVTLRDPSRVSVSARTSNGARSLLSPGSDEQVADVPERTPPYVGDAHPNATVSRHENGSVTLRCPGCNNMPYGSVVGSDGYLELRGNPRTTLAWDGNALAMRYTQLAWTTCGRHHHACEEDALTLWVNTPPDNVIEVRDVREPEHVQHTFGGRELRLAAGITTILGGIAIGLIGGGTAHWSLPVSLGTAGGFVGVGAIFVASGAYGMESSPCDTRVDLPPHSS